MLILRGQIVVSAPNRPQMLQWQHYYNVEIATSNLKNLLNVDITTLHQRWVSFAKNVKCEVIVAW